MPKLRPVVGDSGFSHHTRNAHVVVPWRAHTHFCLSQGKSEAELVKQGEKMMVLPGTTRELFVDLEFPVCLHKSRRHRRCCRRRGRRHSCRRREEEARRGQETDRGRQEAARRRQEVCCRRYEAGWSWRAVRVGPLCRKACGQRVGCTL